VCVCGHVFVQTQREKESVYIHTKKIYTHPLHNITIMIDDPDFSVMRSRGSRAHSSACVYVCMCVCMYVCVYVKAWVCTYHENRLHVYVYVYVYVCKNAISSMMVRCLNSE
jgi:hypothetical protein